MLMLPEYAIMPNTIHCMDALQLCNALPDKSVDLVVTSPPYNLLNSTGNGMICNTKSFWKNAKLRGVGYSNHSDNMPHEKYVSWQRSILDEAMRVIKDDGAIFYNHKWRVQNGLLQDRQDILDGFPVRQIIVWHRGGGFNFNNGYFLPTYEVIYMIAKPKFRLTPGANALGDVWMVAPEMGTDHPAPFPLSLIKRIISSTSAQYILDPFMGSGTTALACHELGRNYIGCDISPEYVAIARKRLQDADPYQPTRIDDQHTQLSLFTSVETVA